MFFEQIKMELIAQRQSDSPRTRCAKSHESPTLKKIASGYHRETPPITWLRHTIPILNICKSKNVSDLNLG